MRRITQYCHLRTCPFCGSDELVNQGAINFPQPLTFADTPVSFAFQPQLWRCRGCLSGFVQDALAEKEALEMYAANSGKRWAYEEPFQLHRDPRVVSAIGTYLSSGEKVLDIGCNTGMFLDFCSELGCHTHGVELSHQAKRLCLDKGHACWPDMDSIPPGMKFDVLTLFDLIEHIFEPVSFLQRCRGLLNEKGKLLILTGDINCPMARLFQRSWWYLRYADHVRFPSPRFFGQLPGYRLKEWARVYVFRKLAQGTDRYRDLLKRVLKRNYHGYPPLGPDHMLVILEAAS